MDFTLPAARQKRYVFGPADLVVFGVPTYAGRVPNLLLPFMKSGFLGNGALAVPVGRVGNREIQGARSALRQGVRYGGLAGEGRIGGGNRGRGMGGGRGAEGRRQGGARPAGGRAPRGVLSQRSLGLCRRGCPLGPGALRCTRLPCRGGRLLPHPPLLHAKGPQRNAHQHPEGQAENQRRLRPLRHMRPDLPHGFH